MLKKTIGLILVLLTLVAPLQAAYEMVLLKNGERVPKPVVITTWMTLDLLLKEDISSLLCLIDKAKDPDYELPSRVEKKLTELAMLEDGSIHDMVRSVILSSVEGEDLEIRLVNPVQRVKGKQKRSESVVYFKDQIKKKLEKLGL